MSLTHLDESGNARMVDVGNKSITNRVAIAKSRLRVSPETRKAISVDHSLQLASSKGDVLQVARIAGIQAAKNTSAMIPLCHMIPIDSIALHAAWIDDGQLEWTAEVRSTGKTGVEMEALVAVSAAALTTYDMCKSIDRGMEITHVALWHKSGGASGEYHRGATS